MACLEAWRFVCIQCRKAFITRARGHMGDAVWRPLCAHEELRHQGSFITRLSTQPLQHDCTAIRNRAARTRPHFRVSEASSEVNVWATVTCGYTSVTGSWSNYGARRGMNRRAFISFMVKGYGQNCDVQKISLSRFFSGTTG